jgi:predicted O-linked N-acetylglucosamine transferase (SPINDLY family)
VVVLEGDRHAARVGASLLRAAGAPELVAADEDAYCAIVRDLVSDRAKLESLRAGLRGRLAASPLLDAGRYGERFHAALRGCWREWCQANP